MANTDPRLLLKKHGKSFNFARMFLGSETGLAAARLYAFCRIVDDIADESPDSQIAISKLETLKTEISSNVASHPVVTDFLLLCDEYQIDANHGITLINGVSQDLNPVELTSVEELIQYAYSVAGVVGLMMSPILGATKAGHPFAIDLGIAMQLTNIARDVLEDAQMQRRYIPGLWLDNISAPQIASTAAKVRDAVQHAIKRLLELAEHYYQSGLAGLYYLPPRNRKAIAVAAYVYREIGRKLLRNDCRYWQGRTSVSTPAKILLASQALWHLRRAVIAQKEASHLDELHKPLQAKLYTR